MHTYQNIGFQWYGQPLDHRKQIGDCNIKSMHSILFIHSTSTWPHPGSGCHDPQSQCTSGDMVHRKCWLDRPSSIEKAGWVAPGASKMLVGSPLVHRKCWLGRPWCIENVGRVTSSEVFDYS